MSDIWIKPGATRVADVRAANKAAGLSETPKGYTWHHHQDFDIANGQGRMQLVKTYPHMMAGHTGGWALWGGGM